LPFLALSRIINDPESDLLMVVSSWGNLSSSRSRLTPVSLLLPPCYLLLLVANPFFELDNHFPVINIIAKSMKSEKNMYIAIIYDAIIL
jgi:hypothetical protein